MNVGTGGAARKLDLSPPVVTGAVAELQERLGLRLLTRTTRVVRVTDAGARFAGDCRRILAEIDDAEAIATGTHTTPRGTLTLTAPVLFGQLYVTTPCPWRFCARGSVFPITTAPSAPCRGEAHG